MIAAQLDLLHVGVVESYVSQPVSQDAEYQSSGAGTDKYSAQQSDKRKSLETLLKCFPVISGLDLKLKSRLTERRPHRLTGKSGDSALSCSFRPVPVQN